MTNIGSPAFLWDCASRFFAMIESTTTGSLYLSKSHVRSFMTCTPRRRSSCDRRAFITIVDRAQHRPLWSQSSKRWDMMLRSKWSQFQNKLYIYGCDWFHKNVSTSSSLILRTTYVAVWELYFLLEAARSTSSGQSPVVGRSTSYMHMHFRRTLVQNQKNL